MSRGDRRYDASGKDQRPPFPRDRDRILYCSAFRRLAGVTQVVSASEGVLFHNRMIHSLKVAQIARRIAEKLLDGRDDLEVSPDVVEAAGLAHDLGHPPFGHIGEKLLNERLRGNNHPEGFEGNPQSFRILVRLAVRFDGTPGLDLTRATLAATMKYPWLHDRHDAKKSKKWAAYDDDQKDFAFARDGVPDDKQTLEAQIMDWADDIAYSVHDLEDFYRAGLIRWAEIQRLEEMTEVVGETVAAWHGAPPSAKGRIEKAFERLLGLLPRELQYPYCGDSLQRRKLRFWTSTLIGRALRFTNYNATTGDLDRPNNIRDEVRLLKQLTRRYVINSPSLAAVQHGQRRILDELFEDMLEASKGNDKVLPPRCRELVHEAKDPQRGVTDALVSMTEAEVISLHRRYRGIDSGTVMNPIVR